MGVLGYSTTPGSNINALAGVGSLAENVMPIKQINDAMRQQVADIAQLYSDVVTGIYTTGTSSAYLAATASGHTVYNNTMALRLRFHVDSAAGAVTVNVNGLGAKSLKIFATTGSRDPVVGEIKADMAYDCVYIAALNCIVVTDPVIPAVDLSSRQPINAGLTALAALATTGLIARTGAGTVATRTITSTDSSVVVTNPGGVAGNIDLSVGRWAEVSGSPFTISGASPYIVSGLGSYRDIRLTGNAVTASVAGGRWVRVGNSGGILATAIYLEAGAALANDRISCSLSVAGARSFTVGIADFNTTNAFKPVVTHISSSVDDLACPGISSALAFDRISIENSVAATLGGTVRIWGRT